MIYAYPTKMSFAATDVKRKVPLSKEAIARRKFIESHNVSITKSNGKMIATVKSK